MAVSFYLSVRWHVDMHIGNVTSLAGECSSSGFLVVEGQLFEVPQSTMLIAALVSKGSERPFAQGLT